MTEAPAAVTKEAPERASQQPGMPSGPGTNLLSLRGVTKRFPTGRHDTVALENISFDNIHLTFGQQLTIFAVAVLTSKGASGVQGAARFKSISTMRLIDCGSRSLPRPMTFWCLGGSASSARE